MKNIRSNGERVLQGEEKNAVLREAMRQQGMSDSDIAMMLGQSKRPVKSAKKPIQSVRVVKDISFRDFEPWSGAKSTYDVIIEEGKEDLMDQMLDEMYPEGLTDTELNDLLWFDSDSVFEWLGINPNADTGIPDEYEYYEDPNEQSSYSRARRREIPQAAKRKCKGKSCKGKKSIKSDYDMNNEDDYNDYLEGKPHPQESEGRVIEGAEKDAILRDVLKQQGYNDNDISIMLGQSVRKPVSRKPVKSGLAPNDPGYDEYMKETEGYLNGYSPEQYNPIDPDGNDYTFSESEIEDLSKDVCSMILTQHGWDPADINQHPEIKAACDESIRKIARLIAADHAGNL